MPADDSYAFDPRNDLGWQARNNLWLVPILVGMGVLAWVGFAYIAARTRYATWIVIAVVFLAGAGLVVFWPEGARGSRSTAMLALWAAAVVVGFMVRGPYLRWAAEQTQGGRESRAAG